MNERIREFAEQATITRGGMRVVDIEKFAELIVKECLKELKDMIVDESELLYPNNKQTTEFVNDRLLDAYDNITELFRVEE